MRFCTNCGRQLDDDAVFCEECGTKQEEIALGENNIDNQNHSQKYQAPTAPQSSSNNKIKTIITICIIIILIITFFSMIKSCSSPNTPEEVASEFVESIEIKFNAKKAVSLMSEDLVDAYMYMKNFSSEKELIDNVKKGLEDRKEFSIGYYGDDWRAKIVEVELEKITDEEAIVIVSVSHKGSEALWNTNIDEWRIYLVHENNTWRVDDYQE